MVTRQFRSVERWDTAESFVKATNHGVLAQELATDGKKGLLGMLKDFGYLQEHWFRGCWMPRQA